MTWISRIVFHYIGILGTCPMTRREVPAMDQHDIPNNAYEATVPQKWLLNA